MSENRKHFSKFRPSQTLQIELSLKRELDFHCFARSPQKCPKRYKMGFNSGTCSVQNRAKASSGQLSKKRLKGNGFVLIFVPKMVPESGSTFCIFLRFSRLLALRVPEGVGSGSKGRQSGLRKLNMSSWASILVYKIPRVSG